jgi:aryl-alcohol dehydrogenase-like predicted oxidoreductase
VALAWVAQLDGVSSVIPGARNVDQAASNAAAGEVPKLSDGFTDGVVDLYDRYFRAAVHDRW